MLMKLNEKLYEIIKLTRQFYKPGKNDNFSKNDKFSRQL